MERKQKGRKKIEIKKIRDSTTQLVTFSKRKYGLFKSTSELCTLCGADAAIIVFSPQGKPFTFGHPDVHSIINRYSNQTPQTNDGIAAIEEALKRDRIRDLNKQLDEQLKQLEKEMAQGEALDKMIKELQDHYGWHAPVNELGLHDLEKLSVSLEDLKRNMDTWINELWINELLIPSEQSIHSSSLGSNQEVD
ncbi:hypothetical protein L1049_009974 [Liquidambar formosana]|uniref:MADS-box domain-containing protein n=1 Tax=Liquidambar formosana TaxID=63359 RepID=A0AAP0N8Y8_LIQFO